MSNLTKESHPALFEMLHEMDLDNNTPFVEQYSISVESFDLTVLESLASSLNIEQSMLMVIGEHDDRAKFLKRNRRFLPLDHFLDSAFQGVL